MADGSWPPSGGGDEPWDEWAPGHAAWLAQAKARNIADRIAATLIGLAGRISPYALGVLALRVAWQNGWRPIFPPEDDDETP